MNKINKNTTDTCGKLREIHMSQDLGVDFTREKFDEIIGAAEAERVKAYRRRKMIRAAIVCLLIGAVCSSLLFGMCTWENATAENDDETKIMEQSGNLIIGSGIVGGDETVGVTVEEYASIDDLPEDIKEKAHFIFLDDFVIERIKVRRVEAAWMIDTEYSYSKTETIIIYEQNIIEGLEQQATFLSGKKKVYGNLEMYERKHKGAIAYTALMQDTCIMIRIYNDDIKIETIIDGLRNC